MIASDLLVGLNLTLEHGKVNAGDAQFWKWCRSLLPGERTKSPNTAEIMY
jgi:hypothetical protein